MASSPTAEYLQACSGPEGLQHCMASVEPPPGDFDWTGLVLQRPLFHSLAKVDQLGADIRDIMRLLERVQETCFPTPEAYLQAQGVPPDVVRLIQNGSVGASFTHVRADAMQSNGEFQIIEINIGSGLGGIEISKTNRGFLSEPRFAAFASERGLGFTDVTQAIVDQLRTAARAVTGVEDPTVAIIEETGSGADASRYAQDLGRYGLNVVHGELRDLDERNGKVVLGGKIPVDLVFRYFFNRHLLVEHAGAVKLKMLTDAHRRGRTALYTPMDADLYERKAALALVREPEIWNTLTTAERSVMERRVPWMRLLGTGFSMVSSSARHDLVEECIARRENLVLKPSSGARSIGVVLGETVSDHEWKELLTSPDTTDYLVQERVVPDDEVIVDPLSGTGEPWHVNWGIFVNDDGYAGTFARGRKATDKGIIGGPGNQSRPGCAFTY